MMELIESIGDIADQFDAIVLDQWGVLHDGSTPYPSALTALDQLKGSGVKLGVLSNSGKRAAPNAARIGAMGFDVSAFDTIMTSGEALWQRFANGQAAADSIYAIEGRRGDAANWADGLSLAISDTPATADAVLLMGLPDGTEEHAYDDTLHEALERDLPMYCSNPDLTSPRGGGTYVMSPGALALRYQKAGGAVYMFGKPHRPIYDAMQTALDCAPDKILMVGDSLHHDVLGAQRAGWQSLLIRAGVHAPDIAPGSITRDITRLTNNAAMAQPDYCLPDLR